MCADTWDVDQAVTVGPWDEVLEGRSASTRYGVTEREEIAGEPLDVALAQEEPDVAPFAGSDDQWALVEQDEGERTWHHADDGPETAALHVETTSGWSVEEES